MIIFNKFQLRFWLAILSLFICGIMFRLWLVYLNPQPFLFDQEVYHLYAIHIKDNGWYAEPLRLYGYPAIIAVIYKFFHPIYTFPWKLVQAVMDAGTALLLFYIARNIVSKRIISWITYVIYLFNPFTSAYAGVMLTEVTSCFFSVLYIYLMIRYLKKPGFINFMISLLVLGYIPQIRPSFLYLSLMLLILQFYFLLKNLTRKISVIKYIIVGLIFYLVPAWYTFIGNWKFYRIISPTIVENMLPYMLANGIYTDRFNPTLFPFGQIPHPLPEKLEKLSHDFYMTPFDSDLRRQINSGFMNLWYEALNNDPQSYVSLLFRRIFYVWDKRAIYYYSQEKLQIPQAAVQILNIGVIFFAFTGLIIFSKNKLNNPNGLKSWFAAFSWIFITYITVMHLPKVTEERYSLPVYPVLFLFAAVSLGNMLLLIKKKVRRQS